MEGSESGSSGNLFSLPASSLEQGMEQSLEQGRKVRVLVGGFGKVSLRVVQMGKDQPVIS